MSRFWLSANLYLNVDPDGYCSDPCPEGALGIIVPIWSTVRNDRPSLAWKIPRLLAETFNENIYIKDILDAELDTATLCAGLPGIVPITQGLDPFVTGLFDVTADRQRTERQQSAAYPIWLCLRRGRKPRFAVLCNQTWHSARPFGMEAFVAEGQDTGGPGIIRLVNGVPKYLSMLAASDEVQQLSGEVWFTEQPSIVYDWQDGTYHQAAARGMTAHWTVSQRFEFLERIANGVKTLHHGRGANWHPVVHGDLRPANITHNGDAAAPANYVVADYGGLDRHVPDTTCGAVVQAGGTILGVIAQARASAFYSPERNGGYEHEEADTAVIVRRSAQVASYVLFVGWEKDLEEGAIARAMRARELDDGDAEEQDEVGSEGSDLELRPHPRLTGGDRIRLRDFVFRIEEAFESELGSVLVVRRDFQRVLHEYLLLQVADVESELDWRSMHGSDAMTTARLSLSRVVETLQWGVRSDLYGLGALSLFAFIDKGDAPHEQEKRFREAFEVIRSEDYFTMVWRELDEVVAACHMAVEQRASEGPRAVAQFRLIPAVEDGDSDDQGQTTLASQAEKIVQLITQTVPECQKIFERIFARNSGHFLCWFHFVLSCVHLGETLVSMKVAPVLSSGPFAYSRRDDAEAGDPNPRLAVSRAHTRLVELRKWVAGVPSPLAALVVDPSTKIEEYARLASPFIQRENLQLRTLVKKISLGEEQKRLLGLGESYTPISPACRAHIVKMKEIANGKQSH